MIGKPNLTGLLIHAGHINGCRRFFSISAALQPTKLLSGASVPACVQLEQVRHKPVYQRIRGKPRPPEISYQYPQGKPFPEPHIYNWRPILPKDGTYTDRPLPVQKLAGRHPETGRVIVNTVGGGNKKNYRWIDYKRHAPEGETIEEKVYNIRYDPLHTHLIALVANGGHRRWIIASENMKPGDIIRTTNVIPKNPIRVKEGDTWPLGAMPPGTLVHNVERYVGEGGFFNKVAGSASEVIKRMGNMVVIKLPYKRMSEVALDERCMATVGRVSNTEHNTVNLLCAQRSRWKGRRPHSGLWHRKDGYCGRKVYPPKPLQVISSEARQIKVEPRLQHLHLLDE